MAPLVKAMAQHDQFESRVCVTAQHREMLDQVLMLFEIVPDFDLDLMTANQTLPSVAGKILNQLTEVYEKFRPDLVLVHGDTATTFAASLAAYFQKIPVGHVEAGLRTDNLYSPWPEEGNRRLTGALAAYHFAPTAKSRDNLIKENHKNDRVFVTGNTVIDALLQTKKILDNDFVLRAKVARQFPFLNSNEKLVLITGHRRENFGKPFERICAAISILAEQNPNVNFVYPVHLNPKVQDPARKYLSKTKNIFLIPPQEYLSFVYLMDKAYLILTDSGGIQEEAPSLGKPVLVLRENTERPEAVDSGTVQLVGSDTNQIVMNVNQLLHDSSRYDAMSTAVNPYGDGTACKKIIQTLLTH